MPLSLPFEHQDPVERFVLWRDARIVWRIVLPSGLTAFCIVKNCTVRQYVTRHSPGATLRRTQRTYAIAYQ